MTDRYEHIREALAAADNPFPMIEAIKAGMPADARIVLTDRVEVSDGSR